ncbi:hypothetical protein PTKIN_Ptkin04bG0243600 [Pterospermum kingtungense]
MGALKIFPIDCWQIILKHLDDDGLEAVSLVCKDFLTISNILKDSLQVVHPDVGMLSKHLNRFKQLKKISFRQFTGNMNKAILEIVRCDVSLDVLDILLFDSMSELLKELDTNSKLAKNLKTLKLSCTLYRGLTDDDLVVIANSFSNLEQLKFGKCSCRGRCLATDYGYKILATKLKFLKKIHIIGTLKVTDRSLIALSRNCAFLKAVAINSSFQMGITENGIGILLGNRPNLEALRLGGFDWSRSAMKISDMLLNKIAKTKLPLKKLELSFCRNFTVGGLLMVSPYLTKLHIDVDIQPDLELFLNGDVDVGKLTHIVIECRRNVTYSSMMLLLSTKCPSLVEIKMEYAKFDGQDNNNNIGLPQNHNILNLCLYRCKIDDESLEQFALMFPNLRVVDLSFCQHLTTTGIEAMLKSCKFMRELRLKEIENLGTKLFTDNSQVINLENLNLERTLIDDEGLAAIAKRCRRLVSLNLNYCTNVTMDGIKQLIKNFTTLCWLEMLPHPSDVLEWMLSTGNFASLRKIRVRFYTEVHAEKFLHHGCLLFK